MMQLYSQWFYNDGWLLISAIGGMMAIKFGLIKSYMFVLPAVFFAVMGK